MLEVVTQLHYKLNGHITIQNSSICLKQLFSRLQASRSVLSGQDVLLDLAGIESADSVLLATVLEVARQVEQFGGKLRVAGLPVELGGLAGVYGVDTLLGSYRVIE